MNRVAGCILKNNEINRVLFAIDAKAQTTIGLRTSGVINVSPAMRGYLCVAELLWRAPNYPL
jgi:hypothetical protein